MKGLMLTSLATAVLASSLRADDPKKEMEQFQGTWKVASVESKGQKAEAGEFKDFKLVVTGDKFVFHAGGDKIEGTFKVDPAKKPKTIDVEGKDAQGNVVKSAGIYEIEKDTWKICYVVNSTDRPKEYKTSPDSDAFVVVYQREKK